MLSLRLIAIGTVLLLMLCGCNKSPDSGARAEMEKIQALSHQWTAAIVARDLDRILDFYSQDAIQMQGGLPAIAGRNAIKAWYQSWVSDPALSYTAATVAIDIASSLDLAYERGTYSFSQTTPKGPVKEIGKFVTVWKKIGGEWKAVLDSSTPDTGPQPAASL